MIFGQLRWGAESRGSVKDWLPVLLEKFDEAPILALSAVKNLARAAIFDRNGNLLAGGLGSPGLLAQATEEAQLMKPGDCCLPLPPGLLTLECLLPDEKSLRFWQSARENSAGAWASWLLTMPLIEDGALRLSRHLLSAFGPWTTPRLPQEFRDQWSLLPLKPGLSRLFIFGDDALAREAAALGARTGLTVTWISAMDQSGPELEEALSWSDFELKMMAGWGQIDDQYLDSLGLATGVWVLVTTADPDVFSILASRKMAGLLRSGEAEEDGDSSGIFTNPVTTAQKALGLITEMLK